VRTQTTLADFERDVRNLKIDTLERIIDTFEKDGVRFENNDVQC